MNVSSNPETRVYGGVPMGNVSPGFKIVDDDGADHDVDSDMLSTWVKASDPASSYAEFERAQNYTTSPMGNGHSQSNVEMTEAGRAPEPWLSLTPPAPVPPLDGGANASAYAMPKSTAAKRPASSVPVPWETESQELTRHSRPWEQEHAGDDWSAGSGGWGDHNVLGKVRASRKAKCFPSGVYHLSLPSSPSTQSTSEKITVEFKFPSGSSSGEMSASGQAHPSFRCYHFVTSRSALRSASSVFRAVDDQDPTTQVPDDVSLSLELGHGSRFLVLKSPTGAGPHSASPSTAGQTLSATNSQEELERKTIERLLILMQMYGNQRSGTGLTSFDQHQESLMNTWDWKWAEIGMLVSFAYWLDSVDVVRTIVAEWLNGKGRASEMLFEGAFSVLPTASAEVGGDDKAEAERAKMSAVVRIMTKVARVLGDEAAYQFFSRKVLLWSSLEEVEGDEWMIDEVKENLTRLIVDTTTSLATILQTAFTKYTNPHTPQRPHCPGTPEDLPLRTCCDVFTLGGFMQGTISEFGRFVMPTLPAPSAARARTTPQLISLPNNPDDFDTDPDSEEDDSLPWEDIKANLWPYATNLSITLTKLYNITTAIQHLHEYLWNSSPVAVSAPNHQSGHTCSRPALVHDLVTELENIERGDGLRRGLSLNPGDMGTVGGVTTGTGLLAFNFAEIQAEQGALKKLERIVSLGFEGREVAREMELASVERLLLRAG